jgi:uncharacterized membrane protein
MPRVLSNPSTFRSIVRRHQRDERGTILIMSIAGLIMAIFASALAVDLGRQAQEKKSDQLIADLAALDAARELEPLQLSVPGVTLAVVIADAQTAAEDSARRNGFDLDDPDRSLTTEVGNVDSDKLFTPGGTPPNAVRTVVTSPIGYVFGAGSRDLTATAVAKLVSSPGSGGGGTPGGTGDPWWWPTGGYPPTNNPGNSGGSGDPGYPPTETIEHFDENYCCETGWAKGGFDLGSALASADFDAVSVPVLNRVMGQMIGGNADVVSWAGLGDANVTMSALRYELSQLGVSAGSPQEMLAADLTLNKLFTATANALDRQGNSEATAAANLFKGSLGIIAQSTNTTTFKLSKIMSFEQGAGDAVAVANLKVRNLVVAAAEAANGSNVISVPDVGVTVPNVSSTALSLQIVEPQKHVFGPVGTSDHTAQVKMTITPTIDDTGLNIPLLSEPKVTGTFPFLVDAAGATGTVQMLDCYAPSMTVGVDTEPVTGSGSGTLRVTQRVPLLGTQTVLDVPTIATMPSIAAKHTDLDFAYGTEFHPFWDGSKRAGTTPLNIAGATVSVNGTPTVVNLPVGIPESAIVDAVKARLSNHLQQIENRIVTPLVKALGLTVGVADVTATDLTCIPDSPPLNIPNVDQTGSLGTPPGDGSGGSGGTGGSGSTGDGSGGTGGGTGGTDGTGGTGTPARHYPVLVG